MDDTKKHTSPKPKRKASPRPPQAPTAKPEPKSDTIAITLTDPLPSQYDAIGEQLKKTLGKDGHFMTLEINHPHGMVIMSGSKNKLRHILERKFGVSPLNINYKPSLPYQGGK